MDKKAISLMSLSLLVASGLLRGNEKSRLGRRDTENNEELIVPGIATDEFVSERYKVAFKYPRTWSKNPRYSDKYEGSTGFFEVSGFSGTGENIDKAVQSQIDEPYTPYGTNPTVRSFVIDGEPARVIYPSADQPDFFKDRDEALVVQYKTPTTIDGVPYKYVVVWTSKEYMPLIISSFRFVED